MSKDEFAHFVAAQEPDFEQVVRELAAGEKRLQLQRQTSQLPQLR